jgi:hypothetical protein
MKKFNLIYYLLFILLVMGAFASMAQNSYGLKIMGGVGFVFGLLFLFELVSVLRKKNHKDVSSVIEPVCLFFLSFIFALRAFFIRFPYVELLFAAAGVLLTLIYLQKLVLTFRKIQPKNNLMAMIILVFHLSIILFFVSLVTVPFSQKTSEITGIIAFILLLGFITTGLLKKDLLVDGESISAFRMVTYLKDHSIIIVSVFLLFSFYLGFNKVGLIPGVYSDEFPQAYFRLIQDVTKRNEKPVNGKYKYENFKEQYDQFLRHNKVNSQ